MQSNNIKIKTLIKIIFTLVAVHISTFAMEQATARTLATGGVCWPIAKFKVTIIPKWTGSIPRLLIKGITTGTTKIIAAAECKKNPIINKWTLYVKH